MFLTALLTIKKNKTLKCFRVFISKRKILKVHEGL